MTIEHNKIKAIDKEIIGYLSSTLTFEFYTRYGKRKQRKLLAKFRTRGIILNLKEGDT